MTERNQQICLELTHCRPTQEPVAALTEPLDYPCHAQMCFYLIAFLFGGCKSPKNCVFVMFNV